MVRYRVHIFFLSCMALYFIVRLIRHEITETPEFIAFYLNDLIFVPAMCSFALIGVRRIRRDHTITIPFHYIFIQTILISVYFEYYLPFYQTAHYNYTSDIMDIVMYLTGGLIFYLVQLKYFSPLSADNH